MRKNYKRFQKQLLGVAIVSLPLAQSCTAQPMQEERKIEEILNHRRPVVEVHLDSHEAIVPVNDTLVQPYLYDKGVSLAHLSSKEKKQKFFDMLLPSILLAKEKLDRKYRAVEMIRQKQMKHEVLSTFEEDFLASQMQAFKAKNIEDLLLRLQTHPTSIVMAQAALESGWGSSRFYLQANNIFGVHSFSKSEERIAASVQKEGKTSYVKKYDCLSASVEGYFSIIARGPYADFRAARVTSTDPLALIQYLTRYSVLKEEYVRRLRSVIVSNDLQRYDSYRLHSSSDLADREIE